jgi:hypothetical protein
VAAMLIEIADAAEREWRKVWVRPV